MDEIYVDKDKLLEHLEKFDKYETVEVPEFKKLMGMGEVKETPVLKIKGASLDDHARAQSLVSVPLIIYRFILRRFAEGEYFDVDKVEDAVREDTLLNNTRFEISLFHRNVVQPVFSMDNAIEISEVFPEVINRVVLKILGITQEH